RRHTRCYRDWSSDVCSSDLLLGHTDTVLPLGTLASMPFRVEGGRAYGPGVHDMKACLVVLLDAMQRADPRRRRALRVFLTADEEIGRASCGEEGGGRWSPCH